MYKQKGSTFYSNLKSPFKSKGGVSPVKQLGEGIGQLIAAPGARRRAKKEQGLADAEFAGAKQDYLGMDFSNPYANMENTMEDLTVNQQAADLAKQQFQQSQSNILDQMQQGGSFNAGNIQALVGAGQQAAAATSADIGRQEAANQQAAARQAGMIQSQERRGQAQMDALKRGQTETLFGMAQQRKGAADQATAEAKAMGAQGWGNVAGGVVDIGAKALMMASDIRLKENIEHTGYSESGIPMYNFSYKGSNKKWSGTMAQDLINLGRNNAVDVMDNGYYGVYYDMIDVDMVPCK
tara:strand:+ start:9844 stop:10728 length:885 start_codon:yes stop_codon:yes gene_type:complete